MYIESVQVWLVIAQIVDYVRRHMGVWRSGKIHIDPL